MRRVAWLIAAAALVALPGCKKSKLSQSAFEAPVADGGVDDPGQPGGQPAGASREADEVELSERTELFCEIVQCDESQEAAVERAMEDARVTAAAQPDETAACAALAEAFRGAQLSEAAAAAYFDKGASAGDDAVAQMARLMSELHGLLDAEQRKLLAHTVGEQGPRMVLGMQRRGARRNEQGPGARGKDRGKERGEDRGKGVDGGPALGGVGDGAEGRAAGDGVRADLDRKSRQALRVERMCAALECTEDQRKALTRELATIERQDFEAQAASMNVKLAVTLRKASAPPEAIERQMRALRDKQADRDRVRVDLLRTVHRVLTPDQRDAVASSIESDGPGRALGLRGRGGKARRSVETAADTVSPGDGR